MIATSCLAKSQEFNAGLVEYYYDYANEDIEKMLMTWKLFFKAFRRADKESCFLPKYVEIMNIVKIIKQEERYAIQPRLELTVMSREESKKIIKQIRKNMKKESE